MEEDYVKGGENGVGEDRFKEEEERSYLVKKAKMMEENGICPWNRSAAVHYYSNLLACPNPIAWQSTGQKAYYLSENPVPTFLAQGPPVLLHPERVVPLSQSEQFEHSYQPNVALAPPPVKMDNIRRVKRAGVIRVKQEYVENSPSPEPAYCNGDENVHENGHENGRCIVSSPAQALSPPPLSPVNVESLDSANEVNSVVEQIASVLDVLSNAEDAVRQRVISLVKRLSHRIDVCQEKNRFYKEENGNLRARMEQLEQINNDLFYENEQLKQRRGNLPTVKQEEEERCSSPAESAAVVIANGSNGSSHSERGTPKLPQSQPYCSPVSVITSPAAAPMLKVGSSP